MCVVCDQICRSSKSKLLMVPDLPSAFFKVLVKPSGKNGDAPVLHRELLRQYDVSKYFPNDVRFKNLLLSPRGLEKHSLDCEETPGCRCSIKLYICNESGCLKALYKGTVPKFAIAQGNWIGQLPSPLNNMSYGTLSLLRPIQSFGRIVSYSSTASPTGGTRLTGHLYSTKLNTTLVRQTVPLQPRDAPVKVLLVSPFATDKSASARAKIASTKQDYIIEPEKIKQTLQFWHDVENQTMAKIQRDDACLSSLPQNDISPEMFLLDKEPEVEELADGESLQPNEEPDVCGGPSLLRSHEETEDAIHLSATVTVGANQSGDMNVHELAANLLNPISSSAVNGKENVTSMDGGNTYILRPSTTFASDSDPDYLEKHYPDLFPFGRGGFGEMRKKRISRKAYLAYLLNLSTRQFQHVDFLLPLYDMITRQEIATVSFVRSKLPSRTQSNNGQMSNGEAFGRLSATALQKAGEYKIACAKATRLGHRLPPAPPDIDGIGLNFFTNISISSEPMQHSQAAANKDRQDVYAAHNSNGQAQIWFTFSPDDAQTYKIVWYALGPNEAFNHETSIPSGKFRFKLLADHPVAAALHFENVLSDVIEHVIGWCQKTNQPKKMGGLFGIPKAWLRVVEEQSRLTLHAHFLIWIYGHVDINEQFQQAMNKDMRDLQLLEETTHNMTQRGIHPNLNGHLRNYSIQFQFCNPILL